MEIAKRIKYSLANNCISYEEQDIYMTVSMGICTANNDHTSFEQIIKDADTAMYKAKTNGRNRIETIEINTTN